jgi:hypothetical protein
MTTTTIFKEQLTNIIAIRSHSQITMSPLESWNIELLRLMPRFFSIF